MANGLEIKVYGKVQGVWFRGNTQLIARELQITGWVRNEPDGTVLINAYGISTALSALEEWCRSGPAHAKVEKVEVRQLPYENHSEFKIQR